MRTQNVYKQVMQQLVISFCGELQITVSIVYIQVNKSLMLNEPTGYETVWFYYFG